VAAKSSDRLKVYSPIDDSLVSEEVHVANSEDVDAAVAAARAAFPGWAATPPTKRAALMHKFADLLEANSHAIGSINTLCGVIPKILASHAEIQIAAEAFRCKIQLSMSIDINNFSWYLYKLQITRAGVTNSMEKRHLKLIVQW
jgi:acyl-CoA reductase-like NAD-dependent aldehyde dehydrogenase